MNSKWCCPTFIPDSTHIQITLFWPVPCRQGQEDKWTAGVGFRTKKRKRRMSSRADSFTWGTQFSPANGCAGSKHWRNFHQRMGEREANIDGIFTSEWVSGKQTLTEFSPLNGCAGSKQWRNFHQRVDALEANMTNFFMAENKQWRSGGDEQ